MSNDPTNNPDRADHEERRLAALAASGLLDSPPERAFDQLTALASKALKTPIALISLIDRDRQFFKSHVGLPEPMATKRQTPLSLSFCKYVAASGQPLIISDARENDLVCANLAVHDSGVIAYAGVPIADAEGFVLGSLCAVDNKPRDWAKEEIDLLRAIAAQVTSEISLRNQSQQLADDLNQQRIVSAERNAMAQLDVHHLRMALSGMMVGMNVLRHAGPLTQEQEEYLAVSERIGSVLMLKINSLLDLVHLDHRGREALHSIAMPPRDLMEAAIDQVRPLAVEKGIALEAGKSDSLPAVQVDFDKFVRVLVHLLGNAIKFTPENGQIQVTAEAITERSNRFIRFSVCDTGIGIVDPEQLFDAGIRVNKQATKLHPTGVGLIYCKRMIEAHSGKIWLESEPGFGSTFHITAPVADRG